MLYKLQPKVQLTSAIIAAAVVIALSYFMESSIDWLTAGSVAVGVAIGMGFVRTGT